MLINIILTEREEKILREAASRKEMSPEKVYQHWARIGQFVDKRLEEGNLLRFKDPTGQIIDPLNLEKKLSPTEPVPAQKPISS